MWVHSELLRECTGGPDYSQSNNQGENRINIGYRDGSCHCPLDGGGTPKVCWNAAKSVEEKYSPSVEYMV